MSAWTRDDLERLRTMLEAGVPRDEIASTLGRKRDACRLAAIEHGFHRPYGRHRILAAIRDHVYQTPYGWPR